MQISGIDVCIPIKSLVYVLKNRGFEVVQERVSDVHFHEMHITMRGPEDAKVTDLVIGSVTNQGEGSFHCCCHWSVVDLERVS